MPDDYLRSIELLIVIVLGCMRGKAHSVIKCDKDDRQTAARKPRGDYNAQLLRKHQMWQCRAMRSL
jgi:hypothetical protein